MAAHAYKQNKQVFQKKSEGRKARIREEKSAGFRAARVILNTRENAVSAAEKVFFCLRRRGDMAQDL